jgi:hypothetical protein
MSIRELTCPDHGHPVGPDDAYCGACGAPLRIATWPKLVPAAEPAQATITPIRASMEFKPLDVAPDRPGPGRALARQLAAVVATLVCAVLLVSSEIMLGQGSNERFWTVTWLVSYAAMVVAAVGWFSMLFQRVRKKRHGGPGDLSAAHHGQT